MDSWRPIEGTSGKRRRSEWIFGLSDHGEDSAAARADGSISRSARSSRVRPYPPAGPPMPRNIGTLERTHVGGTPYANNREYACAMRGRDAASDRTAH